jgi:hypothetical protein
MAPSLFTARNTGETRLPRHFGPQVSMSRSSAGREVRGQVSSRHFDRLEAHPAIVTVPTNGVKVPLPAVARLSPHRPP